MKDEGQLLRKTGLISWLLLIVVISVPLLAWLQYHSWQLSRITLLSIFPLLGLWAWGIMWTHYALGTWRILDHRIVKDETYSVVSRILVLLMIILHPGLLIWVQWKLRGLLPPGSLYNYVNSSLKIFVFFGTISLFLFISFDILEKFKQKPWVMRNWRWISISQMLAMTLIFFHALALGNILEIWWLEYYWVIMGAALIPCFGLIGRVDWYKKGPR